MSEKNTGGPAFPRTRTDEERSAAIIASGGVDQGEWGVGGMTLRDYFAAKAMQSIVSQFSLYVDAAEEAYEIADAMLEARK